MDANRRYPGVSHALLLCLMVVGLQTAVIIPFHLLDIVFKLSLTQHPATLALANLISISLVVWLGMLIGKVPWREVLVLKPVPWRVIPALVITGLGIVILLSEIDNLFRAVFPPPDWLAQLFQQFLSPSKSLWGTFLALVIVAPLTEETLFRGLVLRGFLNRYSLTKAILVSSLLFALLHLNPWQFISAAVLGALFAWWFVHTQSLIPCFFGHMLANGMVFAAPHLPFKVIGFNENQQAFQPLWFDALGFVLVLCGCWVFLQVAPDLPALEQASDNTTDINVGPPPLPPAIPPLINQDPT